MRDNGIDYRPATEKRKERNQEYTEALMELYDSGRWFMFPKEFLLVMPMEEAFLLAFLINQYRKCRADELYDGGWFFCRIATVEKNLLLRERTQQRLVAKLKAKGFLQSRRYGMPAKRYFKVNVVRLRRAIKRAAIGRGDDPSAVTGSTRLR
jgi:hypothetical protein